MNWIKSHKAASGLLVFIALAIAGHLMGPPEPVDSSELPPLAIDVTVRGGDLLDIRSTTAVPLDGCTATLRQVWEYTYSNEFYIRGADQGMSLPLKPVLGTSWKDSNGRALPFDRMDGATLRIKCDQGASSPIRLRLKP